MALEWMGLTITFGSVVRKVNGSFDRLGLWMAERAKSTSLRHPQATSLSMLDPGDACASRLRRWVRNDSPPPDGLVRDHNPALGEQVFDVAEAEREPEVQPNRLVNDLRREPVARVADFLHPLGYRASKAPASGRCRDNARL